MGSLVTEFEVSFDASGPGYARSFVRYGSFGGSTSG
jgi:hypothetical protein